jgi:hypothetical protein
MTMPTDISCAEFDQGVDELAVGTLAEPERSRLLAHAAGCPACEARLNWLAGLADRLLLLVPEVEPPAGFEAGALARMGGEGADRGATADRAAANRRPAAARRWHKRSWRLLAVAAVVVAALAAGIAVGRTTKRSTPAAVARQGEITTIAGADVGTAQVVTTPQPHVLLRVTSPLPWGVLTCQLELAQGRRVTVGSWAYDDSPDGTWTTRIDRSLTGAVLMRIVDQQGTVVATASLA